MTTMLTLTLQVLLETLETNIRRRTKYQVTQERLNIAAQRCRLPQPQKYWLHEYPQYPKRNI